jgi:Flp pilus assembly protein TadG
MGLVKTLGAFASKYRRDVGGQFAVITGLIGLPLMLLTASAVDINRALSQNSSLQSALDAAALAAVIPDNMSNEERYAYAEEVFESNYFGGLEVALGVSGDRELVTIEATAKVPTLISGIVGVDTVDVFENAAAELTKADTVCVLALDPTGDWALEFKDQAVYSSPACSVQVNSTGPFAMVSSVVTPPAASSFCTSGTSQGVFSPVVKNACSPVADPYANLVIPKAATSCDYKSAVIISGSNTADTLYGASEGDLATASTGESLVGNNTVLAPGIYCKGLKIEGANVSFLPGIYHVWGNLEFSSYTQAVGDRVTFILKGESNRLVIRDGAQVWLRAPEQGMTAGLVFWQKHLNFWKYVFGQETPAPTGVTATSEISSGGGLTIIGTAYFPNHELVISSSSPVASQSPATSFIAYRLRFEGRANMEVHVDYETGGIPPMLPRSDDGARLVSVK